MGSFATRLISFHNDSCAAKHLQKGGDLSIEYQSLGDGPLPREISIAKHQDLLCGLLPGNGIKSDIRFESFTMVCRPGISYSTSILILPTAGRKSARSVDLGLARPLLFHGRPTSPGKHFCQLLLNINGQSVGSGDPCPRFC